MNWGAQSEFGFMKQVLMFRPGDEVGMVDRYGPESTLCVLPQGPQTIPYVQG